jgi:hypothetical protein
MSGLGKSLRGQRYTRRLSGMGRNFGWRQDNCRAPLRRDGTVESSAKSIRRSGGMSVKHLRRSPPSPEERTFRSSLFVCFALTQPWSLVSPNGRPAGDSG